MFRPYASMLRRIARLEQRKQREREGGNICFFNGVDWVEFGRSATKVLGTKRLFLVMRLMMTEAKKAPREVCHLMSSLNPIRVMVLDLKGEQARSLDLIHWECTLFSAQWERKEMRGQTCRQHLQFRWLEKRSRSPQVMIYEVESK